MLGILFLCTALLVANRAHGFFVQGMLVHTHPDDANIRWTYVYYRIIKEYSPFARTHHLKTESDESSSHAHTLCVSVSSILSVLIIQCSLLRSHCCLCVSMYIPLIAARQWLRC